MYFLYLLLLEWNGNLYPGKNMGLRPNKLEMYILNQHHYTQKKNHHKYKKIARDFKTPLN